MSWAALSPELRDVIETACTPRQVEVMKLQAAGLSQRRIADVLVVDRASVRNVMTCAHRNIRDEFERRGVKRGVSR